MAARRSHDLACCRRATARACWKQASAWAVSGTVWHNRNSPWRRCTSDSRCPWPLAFFLFHSLGVTAGQEFSIKMVGHESDVRLSTLEALRTKPLPPGATDPIEPPGITTLATGHQNTCCALFPFDYFLHEL